MSNIPLKTIKFPGLDDTYTVPVVDNTLATAGAAADAKKVGDEISDLKQDFSKYHPDLGSGYSTQLLSTVFIEDEVPYNFRTSGGSADIGDREYDEIVGVSMPINQLIQNGDFSDGVSGWTHGYGDISASDNVCTYTLTNVASNPNGQLYRPFSLVPDHVIIACGDIFSTTADARVISFAGGIYRQVTGVANTWQNAAIIAKPPSSLYNNVRVGIVPSASQVGDSFKVRNVMAFDLTLMLGSAIAEYVYGLETATAGSGVSWLKHHFPKIFDSGYISYNAGEMQSVSGLSVHRMTGFNQWDEEWELGTLNSSTGANVDANDRIRSKNFIPVIGGTQYVINKDYGLACAYDANKNYIGQMPWGYGSEVGTYYWNVPNGARYAKFVMTSTYGTTYKNDICINLHWDGERDGEYEEYKEYEYALDDSVVLRGILKLDSNNNLYADGDRYLAEGTVERTWGEVDLGSLTWLSRVADNALFSAQIDTLKVGTALDLVMTKYTNSGDVTWASQPDKTYQTYNGELWIRDTSYLTSTASEFKAAVSGIRAVYPLRTPTTETAEPYQTPQIVDDWGTEEYVSTSLVPVGHDTKYANNLRAKLEMAPNSPDGDGDYLVRQTNGQNEYVAYVSPVPASPTANGTYTLKATVSSGTVTLSWVADS